MTSIISIGTNAPKPEVESAANLRHQMSNLSDGAQRHVALSAKLIELESMISALKLKTRSEDASKNMLTVDKDVITHLNGGTFPKAKYFIFKNVRLCLEEDVDEILEKDNETVFEVNDPKAAKQARIVTADR